MCNAQRHERSEAIHDTRAGHDERALHTKSRKVEHPYISEKNGFYFEDLSPTKVLPILS